MDRIFKSNFRMTTGECRRQRELGVAPVLTDLHFVYGLGDKIEPGDKISIRVGTRRKLFRVERVYFETITYPGSFGYPDEYSYYTRFALKAKPAR